MSWYLTLRSDPAYLGHAPTGPLLAFLATLPELQQTGPMDFTAAPGAPRVSVLLADCDSHGGYACHGRWLERVNVVELVCSHDEPAAWYEALAGRIAAHLGWSAFEDAEERQVWPPP